MLHVKVKFSTLAHQVKKQAPMSIYFRFLFFFRDSFAILSLAFLRSTLGVCEDAVEEEPGKATPPLVLD